jgi:hypothetical protein
MATDVCLVDLDETGSLSHGVQDVLAGHMRVADLAGPELPIAATLAQGAPHHHHPPPCRTSARSTSSLVCKSCMAATQLVWQA